MSDPSFNDLPSSPKGGATPTVRNEPKITVQDIQDFISPKLYGELSWDDNRSADEVTEACIERAKTLAGSLLHLVDKELNLYSETHCAIVKTLTVYELYVYNGDRYKAKAYMEKAERLISNRYGSLKDKRDDGVPVGAICVPTV